MAEWLELILGMGNGSLGHSYVVLEEVHILKMRFCSL